MISPSFFLLETAAAACPAGRRRQGDPGREVHLPPEGQGVERGRRRGRGVIVVAFGKKFDSRGLDDGNDAAVVSVVAVFVSVASVFVFAVSSPVFRPGPREVEVEEHRGLA